jgi:DNA-binding CsgD family transcriptional regulator
MDLLEREAYLEMLEAALREANAGSGQVALVSGEAGIGKSSLVNTFTARLKSPLRALWGACDALFTPHPLGPLHDIAAQAGPAFAAHLNQGSDWLTVARTFLTDLGRRPAVVVLEDVHWADTATLDLLKYLGRRIWQTDTLLILTYRDDELHPAHPLQLVLGDLSTTAPLHRLSLTGLSLEAVRALAEGREVDPVALHRLTNGNPFFVTEVLACGQGGIPATVRDAVLARAGRLSPAGQAVLEAAAVIGLRVEPWLLAEVAGSDAGAVEECLTVGVLESPGDMLAFRHELARQVILEATSPPRRLALHRLALASLAGTAAAEHDPDRLAHHAEAAGDAEAVLKYAPAAAVQAIAADAHREAAAQYARALRFAGGLPDDERAQLLEAHAAECGAIGQNEKAVELLREAAEIRRRAGKPIREGHNLSKQAQYLARAGRAREARRVNRQAIEILATRPPSPQLAWAYGLQSGLHMDNRDIDKAVAWGKKARAQAEWLQDVEVLATNYIGLGSALMVAGDEQGQRYLERSIAMAREARLDPVAALAITNLVASAAETFQFRLADRHVVDGLNFCREREYDYYHARLLAWQALSHLHQGRWDEAAAVASALDQQPNGAAARIEALVVMALVQARRGQPGDTAMLDEALALAAPNGLLQDLALVRAARAEAAWLAGNEELALVEARAVYDLALRRGHAWFAGALAVWCWRAGDSLSTPPWIPTPFARQIEGDWRGAAAAWGELGCPYARAQALADGDEAAQLTALAIFDELGAAPAARLVRQRLQAAGVQGVPRGPRRATQANPLGLTPRQMEVLALLAEGLSNRQIADRLSISRRTAEHHVAAILARLEVASRSEAADLVRAEELRPAGQAAGG